jgi:hypothetical protein
VWLYIWKLYKLIKFLPNYLKVQYFNAIMLTIRSAYSLVSLVGGAFALLALCPGSMPVILAQTMGTCEAGKARDLHLSDGLRGIGLKFFSSHTFRWSEHQ